jgi:hypothetical protein
MQIIKALGNILLRRKFPLQSTPPAKGGRAEDLRDDYKQQNAAAQTRDTALRGLHSRHRSARAPPRVTTAKRYSPREGKPVVAAKTGPLV